MADKSFTKRAYNFKDISGQKFNRLTAIKFDGCRRTYGKALAFWIFRCDCGTELSRCSTSVISGNTKSCGCLRREAARNRQRTHGLSETNEYKIWQLVKNRCLNENAEDYELYGGRGITVCDEWRYSFTAFLESVGPRPQGMSLDRIDNNGHYEPSNVRWTTQKTQCNNKRSNATYTHEGITLTLMEWSERTGIPYTTLTSRHAGRSGVHMLAPSLSVNRRKRKRKPNGTFDND